MGEYFEEEIRKPHNVDVYPSMKDEDLHYSHNFRDIGMKNELKFGGAKGEDNIFVKKAGFMETLKFYGEAEAAGQKLFDEMKGTKFF